MAAQKPRPPRRRTVNIHDPASMRYWTRELGMEASKLRDAVEQAGSRIESVREYLVQQHFSHLVAGSRVRRRRTRPISRAVG